MKCTSIQMTNSLARCGVLFSITSILQLSIPLIPRKLDYLLPLPQAFSWHELLDFLITPFLCSFSFILFYKMVNQRKNALFWFVLFIFGISIACDGHGIHMAANRIHSFIAPGNEWNQRASKLQAIVYVIDEILGHSITFSAWIFVFLLLIWADETRKNQEKTNYLEMIILLFLSLIQGTGLFFAAVEGQFAIPGLTFSFIGILSMLRIIKYFRYYPISIYFHFSSFVCFLLTISWGYYFSWTWPEFRVLGLGPFSTWPGIFMRYCFTLLQ